MWNLDQVYVTTTIIFYAISPKKVRTSHALKQEYGSISWDQIDMWISWDKSDMYSDQFKAKITINNYKKKKIFAIFEYNWEKFGV